MKFNVLMVRYCLNLERQPNSYWWMERSALQSENVQNMSKIDLGGVMIVCRPKVRCAVRSKSGVCGKSNVYRTSFGHILPGLRPGLRLRSPDDDA